jgi:preprotein translocase subunit SecA
VAQWLREDSSADDQAILEKLIAEVNRQYAEKIQPIPEDQIRGLERHVLLSTLDIHWREHLAALDHLRQGIHLRGYAQKNPKQEYKREAFEMFGAMLDSIKLEVARQLITFRVQSPEEVQVPEPAPAVQNVQYQHAGYEEALVGSEEEAPPAPPKQQPVQRHMGKIGRNDPCPCGSGKKYKHCHGRLA